MSLSPVLAAGMTRSFWKDYRQLNSVGATFFGIDGLIAASD